MRKGIPVRFLDWFVPVLVGLLAFLRRPDAIVSPQFWAEDAVIFFQQARWHGLGALLIPYAGYIHLVPRTVAFLGNLFDLALAPAIYNTSWVVILMLSARVVISSRIDIPKFSKYLLAFTLALVPHGGEAFLNITNVQWVLATVLLILIIQRDAMTRKGYYLDLLVLFAIGFTGPFTIIFMPLLLLRFIRSGMSRYNIVFSIMYVAISLIQGYFIIQENRAHEPALTSMESYLAAAQTLSCGLFFGEMTLSSTLRLLITLSFVLLVLVMILLSGKECRNESAALMVGAGLIYFSAIWSLEHLEVRLHAFNRGLRYYYVPYVLIIWSLIRVSVDARWTRYIALGLLVPIMIAAILHFSFRPFVDYEWRKHVVRYRQGRRVVVPINPPGWRIVLNPETKR